MNMPKITFGLLTLFTLVSCVAISTPQPGTYEEPSVNQPEPETRYTSTAESENFPVNETGTSYSGQGPTTWSIEKDPGMALVHIELKNCTSFLLSGSGQNIPYSSTKIISTSQFDDQFQAYSIFNGWDDREENIIIDYPIPYDDFDTPPQTEMLRTDEVSNECNWAVSILPMSAARVIQPGQVIKGTYDDVLRVDDTLSRVDLNYKNSGDNRMFQNFEGLNAVVNSSGWTIKSLLPLQDNSPLDFEDIPNGTVYLVVMSEGYWELQGK